MIKIEHIKVFNFEGAIRGMRNPMNSWDKSDSDLKNNIVGEKDLELARKLYKAGTEHRKYARQIFVSMDITAPLYWISELDTYKVGTNRNSCSFMHRGVSKAFEINDFTVDDERIYYLLNPIKIEKRECIYPYETNEYKAYTCENGREYLIFKNGRILRKSFGYIDTKGRKREFEEKQIYPHQTKNGYYQVHLGGRSGEVWLLHRLIASVWIDNVYNYDTVNHIDGNKQNNSVENLEWCTREENITKGFNDGLYDKNKLHLAYNSWKKSHKFTPFEKLQMRKMRERGASYEEIQNKYNVPQKTLQNILNLKPCENNDLFMHAYAWEQTIKTLNELRDLYLDTKDFDYFRAIRQLLPQGYNIRFTYTMNYENVFTIIKQRTGHKLDEWNDFVKVLKKLPYIEEIIKEEKEMTNSDQLTQEIMHCNKCGKFVKCNDADAKCEEYNRIWNILESKTKEVVE